MALTERLAKWLMAEDAGAAREGESLRQALDELGRDRPERARRRALAVLHGDPASRAALAVWADSADAMGLDEELHDALVALSRWVPGRADLWWRLCAVRQRLGLDAREAALRALSAGEPRPSALSATRWLLHKALDEHDFEPAERFAQRLSLASEAAENTHLDLAELDLERGQVEAARRRLRAGPPPALLDARGWLTVARVAKEGSGAARPLERALLLGQASVVRRAGELACTRPDLTVSALELARALGFAETPEWTLAARLSANPADLAGELCAEQAKRTPSPSVALVWLRLILQAGRADQLGRAVDFASSLPVLATHPLKSEADRLLAALVCETSEQRLLLLDGPFRFARRWAEAERQRVYEDWLERDAWEPLLTELGHEPLNDGGRWLADGLERLQRLEQGPLTLGLVGEFNAGKSSLVNALTGGALAAVGVTPTTAAPACYAWRGLALLDTPGFNAPGQAGGEGILAALAGAHVALWVVDGSLPFRDSEARHLLEIRRRKMPFWVVVNKRDRVSTNEFDALLSHVEAGLAHAELVPVASPCLVSAREPASLREFSERFERWAGASEGPLRRQACLRGVRERLRDATVPSSAEPAPVPGRARSLRLQALARALEQAENNLKR